VVTLALALAAFVAVLFWTHGLAKLRNLRTFAFAVGTWRVIPVRHVWMVALLLPLYEMALASVMALGAAIHLVSGTMWALAATALLAALTAGLFLAGQLYLLLTHRAAACGCAGKAERVGWRSIGRAALVGVASLPAAASLV
jgi:hypothetical protein